jgi:NAD-dependent dihydropyrimidine dehydrogenase PreA subunit
VDFEKCTGCGTCVDACPVSVYELDEETKKTKIVNPNECLDCKACEIQCDAEAIQIISDEEPEKSKK